METSTTEKDRRRARVLKAAISVFARKGFAASRIDDVATEAGVAKGTVYLYFDSRDAILQAAFHKFEEDLLAGIRTVLVAREPALDRLRRVVVTVMGRLEDESELARVLMDFWALGTSDAPAGLGIDLARVYSEYRLLVNDFLREAQAEGSIRTPLSEHTAAVMVGMIEGVVVQWLVDPDAVPPGPVAEQIVDVMIRGLATGAVER